MALGLQQRADIELSGEFRGIILPINRIEVDATWGMHWHVSVRRVA